MKLYKFKSIEGDGFLHSLDMIVNERIYLSTCEAMNDPFEGAWEPSEPRASRLMGNYLDKAEKLRFKVDAIRFTSFTKCFKNELLWAHYAGGFTGVCFEYELSSDEYDIRNIDYEGKPVISSSQIDEVIEGNLTPQDIGLLKSKAGCWLYEDEYRLFGKDSNPTNNNYIHSKPTRIIFGVKNLKYDNIFRKIAKKYGIQISYLEHVDNEYTTYDI